LRGRDRQDFPSMSIGFHEIDALAAYPGVNLLVRLTHSGTREFYPGFLYPLDDSIEVCVADPEAIMVYRYRLVWLTHAHGRPCVRTDEIRRHRIIDVHARALRTVFLPCRLVRIS
jgi:hypothetical protein